MKKLIVLFVSALAAGSLFADTLELADGRTLEGEFVGASNNIIMFDTGEGVEAFTEDQVVGLFLSSGVATAEDMAEAHPTEQITIPQGTRLVIRMSEDLDSRRHQAGHRFRAQLDGAIVIDGVTVVPRGTQMQGQITSAGQARRVAGSSNLSVVFTDFILNDEFIPIATGQLTAQTGNEAGRTAGRTARAAAIGGLIDGSSGARTGAKVGLGASVLTGGESINIPRGSIVETSLSVPVQIVVH
jgi:hypothetical protein